MTLPKLQPSSSVRDEAESTDVVIVGFGIAGASAAVEAARAGARVVLLERSGAHGGTSAMADGHFYLGGGTAVQEATGNEDDAEEMYRYLVSVGAEPELDKIRAFSDDSVAHFEWLEEQGVRFERTYFAGKSYSPPDGEGLMFTGNELAHPHRDDARPAPRGHFVKPAEPRGMAAVMDSLAERVVEAGVEVRFDTGVTNLVADDDGTVVGVAWKRFADTGVVLAPAVVLAAGGFVMNPEMVAEHTPELTSKIFRLGNPFDDGLGLRLGESAGAELRFMDEAFMTAPIYPPAELVTGLIVNRLGERFVAEDAYHARVSYHVARQPDRAAYLILDSEHMDRPSLPLFPFVDGWETVAEMEAALGIPDGRLAATLDRYNRFAANGEDPDFHKLAKWTQPQDQGPWGAYDLTVGSATYAGFTMGGMRTTLDGQAQRADGSVIEGLYAAGACAANIAQDAKGYASGIQLAEGSYFGRRAGRHAAGVAEFRRQD